MQTKVHHFLICYHHLLLLVTCVCLFIFPHHFSFWALRSTNVRLGGSAYSKQVSGVIGLWSSWAPLSQRVSAPLVKGLNSGCICYLLCSDMSMNRMAWYSLGKGV
jgi:hypothetical protein